MQPVFHQTDYTLDQWFSNHSDFATTPLLWGLLDNVEIFFVVTTQGRLYHQHAAERERPGILLNVPQCRRQPPTQERIIQPKRQQCQGCGTLA